MKNLRILLSVLASSFFFLSASCQNAPVKESKVVHWSETADFKKQIDSKTGVLIDVRTPDEFQEGHIPGAMNIDFRNDNFKAEISKLNKESQYLLYCRTANRSGSAASLMEELGFKKVTVLNGGFTKWKEKGLEMDQ